jgi:putative endonuclease
MDDRSALGATGEDAVTALYRSRGFTILARNWRCGLGELDVVAVRDDLLVVCEVKTRRGARFGGGYEAVTARKRAKLRALAEVFLQMSRDSPGSLRFDVASVRAAGRRLDVEIFEDAF